MGRGRKVGINGPGHMTKMSTTPIFGKNLQKSSSAEPEVPCCLNKACSIRNANSLKNYINFIKLYIVPLIRGY